MGLAGIWKIRSPLFARRSISGGWMCSTRCIAGTRGFAGFGPKGAVYTLVNTSQEVVSIALLPMNFGGGRRVLYSDAGFEPRVEKDTVELGPEQLVVVGVAG